MTNERLEEVIRQYNAGEFPSYASFRVLSDSVCFGRVWRQPPAGKSPSESGDYLYFVLNGAACVGVVLDMRTRGLSEGGQDLHWYVLEEHRGKGHLHRALHSVILQHMFQDGRENQRATVRADDARALEYAERQGFQVLGSQGDEIKMLLGSTDQYKDQEVSGMNRSLTKQERDELKQRVWLAKALLVSVRESVHCAIGDGDELKINRGINELARIADEISFLKERQ